MINAADHGMPQRRRRVFILGHHERSAIGRELKAVKDPGSWIVDAGVIAQAFPCESVVGSSSFRIEGDLADITERFNKGKARSPFAHAGTMVGRHVTTMDVRPAGNEPMVTLGDILQPADQIPASFYIDAAQEKAWQYLKGGKKEMRTNPVSGFNYHYSEGAMAFPDQLDKPSRTIVTGEGGASPSRFKHVVRMPDGRLRRLTPVELERLNMFPDGHTEGATDTKRAFLMGNALVTGIVQRIGRALAARLPDRYQDDPTVGPI